jgi:hypothetical protein
MAMNHGMHMIEGLEFEGQRDRTLPKTLDNVILNRCSFVACVYGATAKTPAERRLIKNVTLVDCKAAANCSLGPVILEDVDITNFATGGVCIAWGAAYKHVRLRGQCGQLMLSFLPTPVHSNEKIQQFRDADAKFYAEVDWALDISQAECHELDIRCVPARLIRRDQETQVVVRREKVAATEGIWRCLDLSGTPWLASLENMLQWGLADKVLVAPKRSKAFRRWLDGLRLLQSAGVAEAD